MVWVVVPEEEHPVRNLLQQTRSWSSANIHLEDRTCLQPTWPSTKPAERHKLAHEPKNDRPYSPKKFIDQEAFDTPDSKILCAPCAWPETL